MLAPIGEPVRLGPTGAGAAMKLVANSTLAGLMGLAGETLALADGFGLDQERAIAALLRSPIGPALPRKLDMIESGRYTASFKLSLMKKDMDLVLDAARRRILDLKLPREAADRIAGAERDGLGELDYSAVVAHIGGRDATSS